MISKRLTADWEHYRGSLGGIWEVWRADKLQNHFNVPWASVELPHCFNAADAVNPDVPYYQGQGWYRTRLVPDNPYAEGRTLLHFAGAGQKSTVYVYTEEVSSHNGGYDEFTVDITEAAARVKNDSRYRDQVPVAVECDNSRDLNTIPSDISDFNLYGGLYRHVSLVYVPAVSIERVHVSVICADREQADIHVRARLYNPANKREEIELTLHITDPEGKEVYRLKTRTTPWIGEKELAGFTLDLPKLWSPDAPRLYNCMVALNGRHGNSEAAEAFGIRFYQFSEHGPFYLNGERLLIRGTHRHDDAAGVGAALSEEMIRTELMLIKEMGANFVRLGHYQQSRQVLDLCDQLGLLVWEEIPWCRGGLGGDDYKKQCRDMLTAMIDQHYNHPSIILWGMGNENDWEADFAEFDTTAIRAFMKELHELSHSLDPTRLTSIRRCEFCKDIVDVYSPSIWAGWYRGIYTEYERYTREGFENTPRFLHMEWGADNLAGRHAESPYTGFQDVAAGRGAEEQDGDFFLNGGEPRVSSLGDWSETYFCEMIDWYLRAQEQMNWLTGTAQWAFKDFSTPVRPDSPIPYMNLKGVVERDLTKKEAYYVFQSYWASAPMVRIYGHSWKVRWGKAEELKTVKVYANCDQVELFVNGKSLGVKKRNSRDFPCAGLRWEAVFAEGNNHLLAVGMKDGMVISDKVNFSYQTKSWGRPAELRLTAETGGAGPVYIEAKAYDEQGVFCPDADFFVRFTIAGRGKLLADLGTARGSRKIQLANGRAGIYLDPCGGSSVAGVSAEEFEGVTEGFCTISDDKQ